MRILEKIKFDAFNWLNFESLQDSDAFKFEIYPKHEMDVPDLAILFYSLFKRFMDSLRIGQFGVDAGWGDFCLDTWDLQNDRYDYSPYGKSKSTNAYLKMLLDNEIEPNYNGFCRSLDWDKFLPIILDCILKNIAPYSTLMYSPEEEFVFYFHHTGSIGIYYKDLNEGIRHIIRKAKEEDLQFRSINDGRVTSIIKEH